MLQKAVIPLFFCFIFVSLKILKYKGEWSKLKIAKIVSSDKLRQNVLEKARKSKQNYTEQKTLISVFPQFLTADAKHWFTVGQLGAGQFFHPI